MSTSKARPRVNPALAIFGLLCVAVSILVLVGERDWAWLADSFLGPAILCGLGGVVLAATLWPGRDDRPVEIAPVPPEAAAATAGREPDDRPPPPANTP